MTDTRGVNVNCFGLWLRSFALVCIVALASACAVRYEQQPLLSDVPYASVVALEVEQADEIIQYGVADEQQVWYYQANSNTNFKGVVVFIHGGCWLSQFDIGHSQALSNALAGYGYAVWNVEYRRTGNNGEWPVALEDIRLAIAQLAVQKGQTLDLSYINIVGHSAGGHLAMLAAAQPQNLGLPASSIIKTIGLAPIIDIEAYSLGDNSCQTATPQFMGGSTAQRSAEYSKASVLNYTFERQHTYVLVGGNDALVPKEFSEHSDTQLIAVEGAGHFDWIHPGSGAFKQLLLVLNK